MGVLMGVLMRVMVRDEWCWSSPEISRGHLTEAPLAIPEQGLPREWTSTGSLTQAHAQETPGQPRANVTAHGYTGSSATLQPVQGGCTKYNRVGPVREVALTIDREGCRVVY